jgi:hypothetical protein
MEQRAAIKFCVKLKKKQLLKCLKCWKVRTVKNVYQELVCLNNIKGSKKLRKWECKSRRWKQSWLNFLMLKVSFIMNFARKADFKFYKEVIKRLITRVHHVRPEFQESRSWYLLHDCTGAFFKRCVQVFGETRISMLSHPPYSPDLSLADFFYFLN